METEQNKTAKIFVIVVFAVVVFSTVALFALKQKPSQKVNPFKNCEVIADSCKDQSCKYYYLCNDTEFSDCRVYSCGDKYGMRIMEKDGSITEKTKQKPDIGEAYKEISDCRGFIEVMGEKKCDGNRAVASVRVNTVGECEIGGFLIKIDGKNRIADFERNGEVYDLSVDKCGKTLEVIALGSKGNVINEKTEIE